MKQRKPCPKRTVLCRIWNGNRLISESFNTCVYDDQCARDGLPSGEGYELCQCEHAEIGALKKAEDSDLKGAIAFIYGHYWICEPCGAALRNAGIETIYLSSLKTEMIGRAIMEAENE